MSYTYIVNHIEKIVRGVRNRKRPANPMDWEYITIHNTGNPTSNALGERAWLDNPINTSSTGYHIVIDEFRAIECIPLNENAWHAGDGENGFGNRKTLGVEICESGNYAQTIKNTIDLVANLLYEKGKGIEFIKQHNNWNGTNCPRLLRQGNNWSLFIREIELRLRELNKPKVTEEVKTIEDKDNLVPQWKIDGIEYLTQEGYLHNPKDWIKKIDEPMPVWAVTLILSRILKDLK